MEAINFKGCNICYGKGQPDYIELPANYNKNTGMAITAFKLDEAEKAEIAKTGILFIGISTFGKPLQPIMPSVYRMYHPGEEPQIEETEVKEPGMMLCVDCKNIDFCIKNGCENKKD